MMESQFRRLLTSDWQIQSSLQARHTGEAISNREYAAQGWYSTSVPSTILAGLVKQGVYPDPYVGMNLKNISRERFENSWWYRVEYPLTQEQVNQTVLLEFDGINYRADIWLNGRRIAEAEQVKGAFRRFQFEVSNQVWEGINVLAVEVFPPEPGDFSTGFVDWNPSPPDRNMGIFRPVRLRFCDMVSIEYPCVQVRLHRKNLKEAALVVQAELINHTQKAVSGVLEGRIESVTFRKEVILASEEQKRIEFHPDEFPVLHLQNPRLWWPYHFGEPNLYDLNLAFLINNSVADTAPVRFGIREVKDYRTEDGHRGFRINGKTILIQGAGWTDDLLLADTPETIDAQLQYVRHMNLNCIRLEGIWGKDQTLYDLCDQYGILMMVGWSCHWEHEQYLGKPVDERYGGITAPEDIKLVSRCWKDQVLWLRNHPSIFVWAVASDKVPKPELEQKYVEILAEYDPARPYVNSTGGVGSEQGIITSGVITSEISGSSGMKMLGPYDYTPPVYWYTDTRLGGAYGFNSETGPGAQVPCLDSIRKFIPPEHLWPINDMWECHCGRNEFDNLDRYQDAIEKRYGMPETLEEFCLKAQVLNYELMRPMFEAFRANKDRATGIIQWMLNAAWPKMYWQLYDTFLMPTGAFYSARKACEPLHLLYDYGDKNIYIINDFDISFSDYQIRIRVLNIHSKVILDKVITMEIEPESAAQVFAIPEFPDRTTTYFLDLRLIDDRDLEIGQNFYWLSTQPDVLDYETRVEPWAYYTPSKAFADYRMLNSLRPAQIEIKYEYQEVDGKPNVLVELTNVSNYLAFFLELKLIDKKNGDSILPVFWEDNYISLLPHETRKVEARFYLKGKNPSLVVQGWNVPRPVYE